MDTTADPDIVFDENGISNYVEKYNYLQDLRIPAEDVRDKKLKLIIERIKKDGKGKDYDCLIGVSGGVDSTYVAYYIKKLGLRPLAVHFDNGWNSELAVSNIEKTLKKLEIDLYTYVVDWEEFKEIQVAFLKASVPDGEIPTDHAIYATLYNTANNYGIKHIISGTNIRTEGILPRTWAYGHIDLKYIKAICKKFSTLKDRFKTFPHVNLFQFFNYIYIRKIKSFPILDYINYDKAEAVDILEKELGWVNYGGKHYESIYTRFFQGYILPRKFKMDKRRGHLSTLICSGQITREEALTEILKPSYSDKDMEQQDKEFVLKKFGLSEKEFEDIMNAPTKLFKDYPNNFKQQQSLTKLYHYLKKFGL